MLNLIVETFDRLRYKLPSKPRLIQIEVTNLCNLDCHMCPREDLEIELEHMDWDKFVSVMNKLDGKEEITLTGWGEPFLHPRIFDMIDYCKQRGHRVAATSNGLFVKSSIARDILSSGLDALTFSVDSVSGAVTEGHTSAKVFKNIETLVRNRKNGTPSIRLQATLHQGRQKDLYDVIRYGASIGCQVVNVGRLDRKYAPDLKRPDEKEEERVFKEAARIAQAHGIQLDWLQYSVSSGFARFVYRVIRRKLHRSGRYCLKTFNYAYVSREGNVTPCCLLPTEKMGNLIEGDLKTIWQSDRFNNFRRNYRETCGSCDLWTIAQVDKN
ncbi:MAG: radical SAM/SPASM domain-containing protein [Nitrospinales bacterium]